MRVTGLEKGGRYFGCADALAVIIGRKVDFCSHFNQYMVTAVRREVIPIDQRA